MGKKLWADRVVVVTGASSGIGEEFARQLAARRSKLVLVARSREKLTTLAAELEKTSGHAPVVLATDLSQSGAAGRVADELSRRGLQVEHLINNAGVGYARAVASCDVERLTKMVELNCLALTELTARLLPGMVQQKSGGVLQVASMVGFYPSPYMAAYAASKAYVQSFTEATAIELSGTGVSMTALCPGQVPTRFQTTAGFSEDEIAVPGTLSARETARRALRAYERGTVIYVPGFLNQLSAFFMKRLPRTLVARISAGVLRKLGRFD